MKTQSTTMTLCLLALTLLTGVKMESSVLAQDAAQGDNKRVAARIANEDGERLRKQGTAESLRKAIARYEEALSLWTAVGDGKGQTKALSSIVEVCYSLGEHRQALNYLNQSLLLQRSLKDQRGDDVEGHRRHLRRPG